MLMRNVTKKLNAFLFYLSSLISETDILVKCVHVNKEFDCVPMFISMYRPLNSDTTYTVW